MVAKIRGPSSGFDLSFNANPGPMRWELPRLPGCPHLLASGDRQEIKNVAFCAKKLYRSPRPSISSVLWRGHDHEFNVIVDRIVVRAVGSVPRPPIGILWLT